MKMETTFHAMGDFLQVLRERFPGGLKGIVGIVVASTLTFKYLSNFIGMSKTKRKIRERQALAKVSINKIRQRLEDLKEPIDVNITDLPFIELQAKLRSGELRCREVLLAYQAKALEIHDKTNCATGFLANAEERARKLDALSPTERGMLHGIPISLKESTGVAGEDCTAGMSYFIGKIYEEDANIVKALIKHGAIPFVRTNISQALMSMSCSNPLYGESCHPLKTDRTCGGSSGGEGALIGGKGSILGIGCDMAGSIRIPAHFCGICGMRPTADRVSNAGNLPFGHGIQTLREVYGPMGRDVSSIVAYFKAALETEMFRLDPLIPPIPWRNELFDDKKPMTIGYYFCDGGLRSVPAVERAVKMAKSSLEKMGHKFVQFAPCDVISAVSEFCMEAALADNGKEFENLMKYDIVDQCIAGVPQIQFVPHMIRCLLSKMLSFLHPVEKSMMSIRTNMTVYDWWKKNESREAYRRKFISKMRVQGIEAILCPAFPVASWPLKDDIHSLGLGTYTMLYNLLDFPCGTVPVTHVKVEDVKNMASYPKDYMAEKYIHRISKGSEDLPISVQLVSLPFQEEIVLRLMTDVETGLKNM